MGIFEAGTSATVGQGVLRRLAGDDRGVAMATVVLLGAVLVLVTVVVTTTTTTENRVVSGDRFWEQAVHVAESGVDVAIHSVGQGNELPAADLDAVPSKETVIEAANKVAEEAPDEVLSTPEGDLVVVKDDDAEVVYAVGFSPSIAAGNRKERVVFVEYQFANSGAKWFPDTAIISDGPIAIGGDAEIKGKKGNAHSNSSATIGGSATISGCATGVTPPSATGEGECPDPDEIVPVPVPVVDPLAVHQYSQFDVCSGAFSFGAGKPTGVYAGPAHPDEDKRATAGIPCSGKLVAPTNNLLGVGGSTVTFRADAMLGVYYVDGADVTVQHKKKDPVSLVTIFAGTVDGDTACATAGGSVFLNAPAKVAAHPGGQSYAIVAGGDLTINGAASVTGAAVAHEQIMLNGDAEFFGPVAAESACSASPPAENKTTGNFVITYDGGFGSDFELKDKAKLEIEDVGELARVGEL